MSQWGIDERVAGVLCQDHERRVLVNNRDGGPPSLGKIIQYNKKRATVTLGTRMVRVQMRDLKPPPDYVPPMVHEEPKMPPDTAPRKATPIVYTPPKLPAPPPAAATQDETVRGDLLVIAAQMAGFDERIRLAREALAAAERDYAAAKELRDEEAARLERVQGEYGRMREALMAAADKLGSV